MFVSMVLESGENCIGLTSFDKEDIAGDVNNYTLPKNIVEMCTLYKLSTKTYSFDEFITFLKVYMVQQISTNFKNIILKFVVLSIALAGPRTILTIVTTRSFSLPCK